MANEHYSALMASAIPTKFRKCNEQAGGKILAEKIMASSMKLMKYLMLSGG